MSKIILIFLCCCLLILPINSLTPISTNGKYNEVYNFSVNNSIEYIFTYESPQDNQLARVILSSNDSTEDFPLMVVVRQRKRILSWQVPLIVETSTKSTLFWETARTLCEDIVPNKTNNILTLESAKYSFQVMDDIPIISLSTASKTNLSFTLKVIEEEFYIKPSVDYNVSVTPSQPRYYFYNFPGNNTDEKNFETVVLEVFSDENNCMTVSVQNASCPVYDLNHDIKFDGFWETVNRTGGLTISKTKFPHGFFLVFVVKGDDVDCTDTLDVFKSRIKNVRFIIKPSITYSDYVNAVLFTLLCIGIFYIIFGIAFFYCSKMAYRPRTMESIADISECANTPTDPEIDNVSLDETEYDALPETAYSRELIIGQREVFLCDLARKDPRILKKKSYTYLWHVLTVALFYSLPVIQLVITYQKVLNDTGNQDLCYYNFLCAHPYGFFSDFNHIFSNIGYILFGLLCLWITYRREKWHEDLNFDRHYGIPQHYGLFYAMGVALILEGILSGSYHICPNHSNFQFDTSFMYITAVLCMVKIYQNRHPDINATAYATFGVLAIAILLGMIGILAPSLYFWILFTIIHLITCFYLTAQIYYMGCWKLDRGCFSRVFNRCINDYRAGNCQIFKPIYKGRVVLLILGNMFNWALAFWGIYNHTNDFAQHLLGIFMSNTILYFTFYVIMKLLNKEKINMQATVFLVISLTCAATAMYCFLHKSISWALTPAMSREFNQECKLFRFYDFHDIWHFLSAIGMFFMFMVLLTLDDDISHVHRSKIPVF